MGEYDVEVTAIADFNTNSSLSDVSDPVRLLYDAKSRVLNFRKGKKERPSREEKFATFRKKIVSKQPIGGNYKQTEAPFITGTNGPPVNNNVSSHIEVVRVTIYDVAGKPQLSIVIIPVASSIVVMIMIISGIALHAHYRNRLAVGH